MINISSNDFGSQWLGIVIICCALFKTILFIFMLKKVRRISLVDDSDVAINSKINKILYKDAFSDYKCGHVECACAPDPSVYKYVRSEGRLTPTRCKLHSLLECRNIILIKNNTYDLIVMMGVAFKTIVACV